MTFSLRQAHDGPEPDEQDSAPQPKGRYRRGLTQRRVPPSRPRHTRASRVLRHLLAANAGVENFTIRRIMTSIEGDGTAASLMLFSIPAMVPVPGTTALVGTPTMAVAGSLMAGRSAVRLPRSILEHSVPRRSLALAVHAILPVLERVERMTKERWSWLCTPAAHRVIGVLVFLLALPLTFPVLGFGLPHAASLFTIALGMIERDGLLVALGAVAGIAALVFVTGKSLAPGALAKKLGALIKGFAHQATLARKVAAAILRRAWRWLFVKLVSGRPAAAKRAGAPPQSHLLERRGRTESRTVGLAPVRSARDTWLAPLIAA